MKPSKAKDQTKPSRTRSRSHRRSNDRANSVMFKQLRRYVRVQVRPPRVNVTTPPLQLDPPVVQVEAPVVQIEAPKPIVIPAPIVKVDVESEESPDQASMDGLRLELKKCMKKNQLIEVLLTTDWGPESRSYRIGKLVRVDEGIVELQTMQSSSARGARVIIPITRIVAIIPNAFTL